MNINNNNKQEFIEKVKELNNHEQYKEVIKLLPTEKIYPLSNEMARRIGSEI